MTSPERGSVFFLTDYGGADEFAGVVRAVVARHAPGAPLVDLTHAVKSFDVRAGALALERAAPHLGPGVVLAVVDPGVGTQRRGVAVERAPGDGPRHFVGPDNGLLAWALDALGGTQAAVALERRALPDPSTSPARTFDGRDLFAPVAGRLWAGARLEDVGTPVHLDGLVRLPRPQVAVTTGAVEAEVQWVDHFGNVQLAARPDDALTAGLGSTLEAVVGAERHRAELASTFSELEEGALGVVTDANGQLALVLNRRSAATVLGVDEGDVVTLREGSNR